MVETLSYDSFGNSSGSTRTRYTFTGRERDSDTGLIYYRARWYDPQQGRFVSEDPIGFVGGINLFAYVENNPVRFSDPSGLCPQDPSPTDRQKDFYNQYQKKLARCIWKVFGSDYQGNPLNGAAILPRQTLRNAPAIDSSRTTASMPGNALGFVSDSDLQRGRFGTIYMASNIGPFMNQHTGVMMTTTEVWNRTYAHELGNLLAGRIAGSNTNADLVFGDPRGIENASRTYSDTDPGARMETCMFGDVAP